MFRTLVSQILDRAEPLLSSSISSEVITVFQYYSFFSSHGVSDLETYLSQLARQGRPWSPVVWKYCLSLASALVRIVRDPPWLSHKTSLFSDFWVFVDFLVLEQELSKHTGPHQGFSVNRKLASD